MWSKSWFGIAVAFVAITVGGQRGFAEHPLQNQSDARRGAQAQTHPSANAAATAPPEALRAVDGDWIFIEDRTEGRTLEQLTAPMSSSFSMKVESGAVILNGHGSGHKDVRVALDGSATERPDGNKIARYRGRWNDGAFEYEVAFEYLRVVERDGGLVYIAQPGGKTATEFVLTELTPTRAVFDNPRHDYPKRIVYELSTDGALSATIGYLKGGTPRRFDFTREVQ